MTDEELKAIAQTPVDRETMFHLGPLLQEAERARESEAALAKALERIAGWAARCGDNGMHDGTDETVGSVARAALKAAEEGQ